MKDVMRKQRLRGTALFLTATLIVGMAVSPAAKKTGAAKKAGAVKKPTVTNKLKLVEGEKGKIKVKGKYIKSVKYKSDGKKIATVNKKGKVTAKKAGFCNIKVTVKYKKKKSAKKLTKKNYSCKVTVKEKSKRSPAPPYKPSSEFEKQTANFSIELLKNVTGSDVKAGRNVMISPESVICALAMTANGAAGNTLSEFQKVLYGDISRDEFNRSMYALNENLTASAKVKFHLANSIWLKKSPVITVKDDFVKKNKELFQAQVKEAPFDDTTLNEINQWVKKNTDGMIDKILDNVTPDMVAALVNAVAFEGKWEDPYENRDVINNADFTNSKGAKEKVNMLRGTEYVYLEDDKATGFVKDYEGGKYSFVAILPKDGVSVSDYIDQMTGEKFLSFYNDHKKDVTKVHTKMPEFSYDYTKNLNDAVKAMGIKEAFSEEKADFSDMMTVQDGNVFISDVLHKTHIELDRNGTKAAAATAVIAKVTSAMPDPSKERNVFLDRPFVYAIVEAAHGFPIFMGAVNSVAK